MHRYSISISISKLTWMSTYVERWKVDGNERGLKFAQISRQMERQPSITSHRVAVFDILATSSEECHIE